MLIFDLESQPDDLQKPKVAAASRQKEVAALRRNAAVDPNDFGAAR